MTAPVHHSPPRWSRRRTVRLSIVGFVLALLLAPVAFLFGQLWTSTGRAIGTATTERAAVAHARPLTTLLSTLVDAQDAAVRGAAVDASGVRAAVAEVAAVDRRFDDLLRVRQRWTQLTLEVDSTLAQKAGGADAFRAYAVPIALTQALLGRVADAARVAGDSGSGPYHLIDVAMHRLPDVVAAAGQVAALASIQPAVTPAGPVPAAEPDPLLPVGVDRLVRAAEDVGVGLQAGANDDVDLRLLGLLDEFVAAADELAQTTVQPDVRPGAARDRVDTASTRVRAAALALEAAVLDTLDARLTAAADGHTTQRRILLLAGVLIVLAAGALLWLRVPGPAPEVETPGIPSEKPEGLHGRPAEGDDVGPDRPRRIPDLVDARELLTPALVHAGRVMRTEKRQDHDDPQ